MQINWLIVLLASFIPMVLGFIWYHPSVFGNAWMKTSGVDREKMKGANMALIFSLSFIFSFLIAFELQFVVIHQFSFYSILVDEPGFNDPNSPMGLYVKDFISKYGNNFHSFKHGALHGTILGIFLVFPLIATNALYERRGFKYMSIVAGYWTVSFALVGGLICAYAL